MKILNVTKDSGALDRLLDEIERDREEVVLIRNHREVARLIPEPGEEDAHSVFADLEGIIDDDTGEAILRGIESLDADLSELKNSWDS